ncbi:hypothetical protein CR513_01130, partial [Mucuna pruriens]
MPKVAGGDRLDHQRTTVDLILSVLANEGGPQPSTIAIAVEDGTTESRPSSVLHSAKTKSDQSLLRPYRLNFCREQLGKCRDGSILCNLEPRQMENNDRTLKELATPDVVYQPWRGPPQASEGIPCGFLHNEAIGDIGGVKQTLCHLSTIGRALMEKTPAVARHLISNMASNTQQFGIRGPNQSQTVNEIGVASNQRLENQLTELTSIVRQLAVCQHQPTMAAKICGICTSVEHPTDMCPTLQDTESDQLKHVGAVGGFQYGKQQYQTRPFDNQHYRRPPFWPSPPQGPYAAQKAGSMPNMPHGAADYQ